MRNADSGAHGMLQSIANRILLVWGWRRAAVAVSAGALSALSQAPYHLFPILWITLPVIVWLIDGAVATDKSGRMSRIRPAAVLGWQIGFGYFLAGLWWIGSAFLVEADIFGWLMPFAVVILPAGLALFWAAGFAAARAFWSDSPARILVLAVALGGAEWLRGHLFTGLPWNALGYGLAANEVQMQAAALIGVESMTTLAIVIFAVPAIWSANHLENVTGRWLVSVLAVGFFAAVLAYGTVRLTGASDETNTDVRIRIVQPAIAQVDKWRPENRQKIFDGYLTLSDSTTSPDRIGMLGVTHLIWPESAFPFLLTETPGALAAIAELLPPGTTLITGAVRAEPAAEAPRRRFFNSVYVIDDDGTILNAYDKVDLLPFGEYLPLQPVLESLGLQQLTRLAGGFSAGSVRRPMAVPGAPDMLPLICYEIIFPGNASTPGSRPGWIVNVTNDAWFGDSPGPHQHLHQARLRAVENGIPVIRAANTGISAVIDSYGRIVTKRNLNEAGVIDTTLPATLPQPLYPRHGYLVNLGISVFLILLTVIVGRVQGSK